jgi:tetratricopeptide (TPR) repeat protein
MMTRLRTLSLEAWLLFFLPVLVIFIYWNTWEASFHLDDDINIVENHAIHIQSLTPTELIQAGFESPLSNRFVANISLAINYYVGGLHVFGYHVVNFSIHLGTAALVYLFLYSTLTLPIFQKKIFAPQRIAATSALLWAIHPIQTQAVTYIIQRMTSLAAFFYLLAFILYIQGRKKGEPDRPAARWYVGAAAAALFSFGSKEIAVTLPFMVILYDLIFFCRGDRAKTRKAAPAYLLLFFGAGLLGWIYLGGLQGPIEAFTKGVSRQYGVETLPIDVRLMTGSRVIIYYFSLLLFPHPGRLNLDYDFSPSYALLHPPTTLFAILILTGFLLSAFYNMKRRPLFSFFVFWYLGNLILESSFLQLDLVFEHRLYLPSIAFFLGVALALERLRSGALAFKMPAAGAALVVLIFFQTVWSVERNRVWKDEITLWEDTVLKSPQKARPHKALGTAYAEAGRLDEATEALQQALRINGNYAKARTNLGVVYYKKGETSLAIEEFQKAIAINERDALAYYNLANIFTDQGRWDDAIGAYRKGTEILPNESMIRHNLAYALNRKGMSKEAMEEYLKALEEGNRLAPTHKNLAALYVEEGSNDRAIYHYKEVIRLSPNDLAARLVLGRLYKKERLFDLAVREYEEAIRLQPAAAIYYALGTVFDQKGDWERAITAYQKAIQIDPKRVEAGINLGVIYQKQYKIESAMNAFLEVMRIAPDMPEAHNDLGFLYQQKGWIELARLEYQLALKFRPEWDLPRANLNSLPVKTETILSKASP